MKKQLTKKRIFPKAVWRGLWILGILILTGVLSVAGLNLWVTQSAAPAIHSSLESRETYKLDSLPDCIIILGAGLRGDEPSPMLKDRLDKGIEWYKNGAAPKILMSGDHGQTGYNEVQVMKQYAIDAGVPSQDIFMDHAGFSTYESMIRARDIFGVKQPLIVTQKYHIYRAVFIGKKLGLNCIGIPTDAFSYGGQFYRNIREYIARCKDVFTVSLGTEPTYGGEEIPISGDGDMTND